VKKIRRITSYGKNQEAINNDKRMSMIRTLPILWNRARGGQEQIGGTPEGSANRL